MKYSTILISILATSQNDKADATFTIAATDKSTGQIGASGSSCVSFDLYTVVYHSIPKHGLCLTQAMPPSNPGWDPSATKLSPVYSAIDTLLSNVLIRVLLSMSLQIRISMMEPLKPNCTSLTRSICVSMDV
jgi:hypothetical protein